ncbi:hypothetical protein CASFOL_024963 [Castilleja foliolosa]|uniref:Dof zinc finger protein n=1 Tax=Castilleja foliolosa TaxID=1961234 RepID=A0ABD3CR16_9LAMI
MQNPSLYSQINAQVQHPQAGVQFPEQEHLKCPRCDSANTKFCYYNNYNLSQPRHFCKNCKRYWTKGGTLRNIPVGGGSRKNAKRSSSSSFTSAAATAADASSAAKRPASAPLASDTKTNDSKGNEGKVTDEMPLKGDNFEGQFGGFMGASGSFSSLMGSTEGQYSNFLDGQSGLQMGGGDNFCDPGSGQNMDPHGLESGGSNNADGFLNIPGGDGGGAWSGGSNGWPDLSMYTPGSNFL